MAETLLPSSISAEHIKVFEQIVSERLAAIPMQKVFIYIIDTVDAQALPYLARQFNVLGNRGWRWADTEQKQRDLLKRAVAMQRKEGTPFAVKESLKIIGIENAEILHPIPGNIHDGSWSYNGTITYGGAYHWACFKVLVDIYDLADAAEGALADAVLLINEWKNVRSWLISVEVGVFVEDTVTISDDFTMEFTSDFNEQVGPVTYDGSTNYDGSATHNGSYDDMEVVYPAPIIDSVSDTSGGGALVPFEITENTSTFVYVRGSHFYEGATVTITEVDSVVMSDVEIVSSLVIKFRLNVDYGAALGFIDITVTNVGGNSDTLTNAIEITA